MGPGGIGGAGPPGGSNVERLRASATQPRTRVQCWTWGAAEDIAAPDWNLLPLTLAILLQPGPEPSPPVPALSDAARTRGSVSAASVLCPPWGSRVLGGCQQPTSPTHLERPAPRSSAFLPGVPGPCPVGSASSLGLCRKSVKRSIPEDRSPAQSQAPPSLLRRALQTFGVAFPFVPSTRQQEIFLLH